MIGIMKVTGTYLYPSYMKVFYVHDLTKFQSNKSLNKMINQGRKNEFRSGGAQIISRENKINRKITSKWLGETV